jgi:outer membrane receptor for ferrienterochelin and colicin
MQHPFILILVFMGLFSLSLTAQDKQYSFNDFKKAQDNYNDGEFDLARTSLSKSQGKFFKPRSLDDDRKVKDNDTENKALRLLALIAIAEDSITKAKKYVLQIVKKNPNFKDDPHVVFDGLFNQIAADYKEVMVSLVSKKPEDIRTAPASVILISRNEIVQRGYMDLVELLSDLPGFDISKIYSATYANIFQLGFRQENTERTLLMIDGVEENDIWSNIAYISRQYPISNIKAVEILYGPSSTMYGPRAFMGAINIITYPSGERPGDGLGNNLKELSSGFYSYGQMSTGSYGTLDGDVTIGLKKENYKLSVTGKYFYSDENDLSDESFYDYNASDLEDFTYDHLDLREEVTIGGEMFSLNEYVDSFNLPLTSSYLSVDYNANGEINSLSLTPEGKAAARAIDVGAYTGNVNGSPNGYSNYSRNLFLSAKLNFANFELGLRTWKREEGFNYYQDIYTSGAKNGNLWVPRNNTVYIKYKGNYSAPNGSLSFSNLLSYHYHALDQKTKRVNFTSLGVAPTETRTRDAFHLAHLFEPEVLYQASGNSTTLIKPGFRNLYFYYAGQQFRNDSRLFYDSERFDLVAGLEFRSSLMQGDYLTYSNYDYTSTNQQDTIFLAQELGTVNNQDEGSNQFPIFDCGLYLQGNYSLVPDHLILTLGARADYNRIRTGGGYGSGFSPRLSLVYYQSDFYLKGIFSRGLQNVSQFTKFSTGGGRIANPTLETEKINYYSIAVGGNNASKDVNWELMGYYSFIQGAVASDTVLRPGSLDIVNQNRNIGEYRILGAMGSLYYRPSGGKFSGQLNYTYISPYSEDSTKIRIGDIAAHHINFSTNYSFDSNKLLGNLNIRGNYVSDRPVGVNTTQTSNPGLNNSQKYPAYLVFNGSLSLGIKSFENLRVQFTVNNLLNRNILDSQNSTYYHPGPRQANATESINGNVPFVPQRGRHFILKTVIQL